MLAIAGGLLVLVALHDVAAQLVLPRGGGRFSRKIMAGVWRVAKAVGSDWTRRLAGPTAVIAVIAVWVLFVVLGFAMMYLPYLPNGFHYASGLAPAENAGFGTAIYISLVALGTLGFGDIVPTVTWLRFAAPIEAFVGFAVITVSISWILATYPAVALQRTLSREVALLGEALRESGGSLDPSPGGSAGALLGEFTVAVVRTQRALLQHPVSYYFHAGDERDRLPAALIRLLDVAESIRSSSDGGLRLRADMLRRALDDLAATIGWSFLHGQTGSTRELLDAFAEDHGIESTGEDGRE